VSEANTENGVDQTDSSADNISLKNVSVKAGNQSLLSEVNAEFPAGEKVNFDADHCRLDQQ